MPRLFGLNVLGVIAATVAFFMVGFVVYGVVFAELWQQIEGVTAAEAEAAGMSWLAPALLITVLQVIGIGLLLRWRGVTDIAGAVMTALTAWILLAIPLMAYDPIYIPGHSSMSLVIDGIHLGVGWTVSAVILTLIK